MSKEAWLTPDDPPAPLKCWRVFCPDGEIYEAALRGALLSLSEVENWEKHGVQTPEAVAEAFAEAWNLTVGLVDC